ncbi:MAG: hypothetical protein PF495_09985, partial [Spirochaetales bacterium]|nr:hypothetical protein [Spirochaetales bacterium]
MNHEGLLFMTCLYLHIGLPKTATTTLQQDVFPFVDHFFFDYIGVAQPRGEKNDSLFNEIYRSVNTGDGISDVKNALKERLAQGKSLIVSEEIFTVTTVGSTWQKKLENLGSLLDGVDYKILLTVREPTSAMFSCYVELYRRYKKIKSSFPELAIRHNDFKIYNYDYLFDVLAKYFGNIEIYVQSFEKLVAGDISSTLLFLGNPDFESDYTGIKTNNSKKSTSGAVLLPNRLELRWVRRTY